MTEFPFVDQTLARRLERAEGAGCARFVEARAALKPDVGACWIEESGTWAMFDGPTSPITQTFGLGVFEPMLPEGLDRVERFFQDRGAPVWHEVSPLANPSTLGLLTGRGYRPIELSSVMFRPISAGDVFPGEDSLVTVRRPGPEEWKLWADTSVAGWSEFPEYAPLMAELAEISARRADAISFLAECDGEAAGTGSLVIEGGVALLAGASTVPAFRRRGAQLALLGARLRHAVATGCDLAMITTQPGSGSQRNAERHGFRIAYTRIKWQLGGE